MQTFARRLSAVLVLFALALPAAAQTPNGDPSALLARMARVNASVHSYQADVHVDVVTHGFPYISPSLDGKAYFEQPDRNAVVFDTIPALAAQFKKVLPQLEPPSEWPAMYDVTLLGDDGTTARLRLVRKKNGRVDHVDVTVDDKNATVTSMQYVYKDGGTIAFRQTYTVVDGAYVIATQTGNVDIPHYRADVASTFSNYRLNVKLDESIFATD